MNLPHAIAESPVSSISNTHPSTLSFDAHEHAESASPYRDVAPTRRKPGHTTYMNVNPEVDTTSMQPAQEGRHPLSEETIGTFYSSTLFAIFIEVIDIVSPADGKTNKGKGMAKERLQAFFNKGVKLQNGMNEVDQAFKPVIQQMFALHEFYQQVWMLPTFRSSTI